MTKKVLTAIKYGQKFNTDSGQFTHTHTHTHTCSVHKTVKVPGPEESCAKSPGLGRSDLIMNVIIYDRSRLGLKSVQTNVSFNNLITTCSLACSSFSLSLSLYLLPSLSLSLSPFPPVPLPTHFCRLCCRRVSGHLFIFWLRLLWHASLPEALLLDLWTHRHSLSVKQH